MNDIEVPNTHAPVDDARRRGVSPVPLLLMAVALVPFGWPALLSPLLTMGAAIVTRRDEQRALFWMTIALTVLALLWVAYLFFRVSGQTFSASGAY